MRRVQKTHKPIKENNGISYSLGTFHLPPGFNFMLQICCDNGSGVPQINICPCTTLCSAHSVQSSQLFPEPLRDPNLVLIPLLLYKHFHLSC